jgi:sigma-B regulation protein RsbU (phosphoserine phosphatase)
LRILIADDDPVSRRVLETTLVRWGREVIVTCDGFEAWEALRREDAPRLAILDWMMPGIDGTEVCRRVRGMNTPTPAYLILLTTKGGKGDIVAGLEAGANDYLTKPFERDELRARVGVGAKVIELQANLAERVRELEEALSLVKQLQGILPICSYCKKIRDDQNYWRRVESYISEHSEARFSHGICPDCYEAVAQTQLEKMRRARRGDEGIDTAS